MHHLTMRLPLLLCLLLAGPRSHADCGPYGIEFWPKLILAAEAPTLVVTMGAYPSDARTALTKPDAASLVTMGDRVRLHVKETLHGFNLIQLVLVGERPLQPGSIYTLDVLGLEPTTFHAADPATRAMGPRHWVATGTNTSATEWTGTPVIQGTMHVQYGCGPATAAQVTVPAGDAWNCLVRATVMDVDAGSTSVFHVVPGEIISIGHHMCYGAFSIAVGVQYTVQLELMDPAGRLIAAPGGAVPFNVPAKRHGTE